jgi:hypothetical protein
MTIRVTASTMSKVDQGLGRSNHWDGTVDDLVRLAWLIKDRLSIYRRKLIGSHDEGESELEVLVLSQ